MTPSQVPEHSISVLTATCHVNSFPIYSVGDEWQGTDSMHTQFSQLVLKPAIFQVQGL